MKFSAAQRKTLLITWSLVLVLLYAALWLLGDADAALIVTFFVILPMQVTCLAYLLASAVLLVIWAFGGRQRNHRDYAIIMLTSAAILLFLLRNTPWDYLRPFFWV